MKIQLFQPQAISELGHRKNQEDSIYPAKGEATEENRVFVVCDGMGGLDKGEVASAAVCEALSRVCERIHNADAPFTDDDFRQALKEAYDALDAADVNNEAAMGTTMTFICFHRGGCLVAHIGDSRIYHLRPSLGYPKGVLFRSRDHSLVQQLYELGEISYYEMGTSPRKNVILRAMQPHQEQRTKATFAYITDVNAGDYFYLCTDGMLEQMEDDELLGIVGDASMTDEQKVERLVELTVDNADNHSGYLIQVKSVETEPEFDAKMPNNEPDLRKRNKCLNDHDKNNAWSEDDVEVVSEKSNEDPFEPQSAPTQQPASSKSSTASPADDEPITASKYKMAPNSKKKSRITLVVLLFALLVLLTGVGIGVWLFLKKGPANEANPDDKKTVTTVTESQKPQPGKEDGQNEEGVVFGEDGDEVVIPVDEYVDPGILINRGILSPANYPGQQQTTTLQPAPAEGTTSGTSNNGDVVDGQGDIVGNNIVPQAEDEKQNSSKTQK